MNYEEFDKHWDKLNTRTKHRLREFAVYPTEGNWHYVVGYVRALNDVGHLEDETYTYFVSLSAAIRRSHDAACAVLSAEI